MQSELYVPNGLYELISIREGNGDFAFSDRGINRQKFYVSVVDSDKKVAILEILSQAENETHPSGGNFHTDGRYGSK